MCGLELEQHLNAQHMDHATLRAKVYDYFQTQLDGARQRRDTLGPFSPEEFRNSEAALRLLEQGNRDYWHTMGREHAQSELDRFIGFTGLPEEEFRDLTPTILDEIRKARIGATKALLEHVRSLDVRLLTGAEPHGECAKRRAQPS